MLWPAGCGGVCNVMSRIVASLVCNLTMRQILRHIELNIPSIITFHSTHSLLAESTTAAHSSAPARNYLIWWVASLPLKTGILRKSNNEHSWEERLSGSCLPSHSQSSHGSNSNFSVKPRLWKFYFGQFVLPIYFNHYWVPASAQSEIFVFLVF